MRTHTSIRTSVPSQTIVSATVTLLVAILVTLMAIR